MNKIIKITLMVITLFIIIVIGLVHYLMYQKSKSQPKTLAGEIAKNIREHPGDWIYVDVNNNKSYTIDNEYPTLPSTDIIGYSSVDTLINKKCGIRINFKTYSADVVSPDTFQLSKIESDTIVEAFRYAVFIPHEQAIEDSLNKARNRKEQAIINNFCK